tara:strand:+ start:254 stop:409 length:156 start_codon:yes stop_codon:yes gene_type:complete
MSIKERAVRLLRIEQLKKDRQIYTDAIKTGHKFSIYYAKQVAALDIKIEAI